MKPTLLINNRQAARHRLAAAPRLATLGSLILFVAGCAPEIIKPRDTGLEGLALTRVDPALVLPGTRVVLTGQSFVPSTLGATQVRIHGSFQNGTTVDLEADVTVASGSRIELSAGDQLFSLLGGVGDFDGEVAVEVTSTVDKKLHSASLPVKLSFATDSTPRLDAVGDQVSFVNQPTEVNGDGFLLGGDEGETRAELTGCFTPAGQTTCGAQKTITIPAVPATAFDRTRVNFPYITAISGIGPGAFDGKVVMVNVQPSGTQRRSIEKTVHFDIQKPAIFGASTTAASLGQYVVINGGGFIGGNPDEATLLDLKGTFTPDGGGAPRMLDLELVPEFVSGPEVRYVLSENDPLGMLVKLRKESGIIQGTVQPIVADLSGSVSGDAIPVALLILPVKQVVWVHFLDSYVESLRHFGLRAADPQIRARVLEVAARDYAGVNIEFRAEVVTDFALFATVDLAGPDPNGQGLLGYDNTPGKDTDNLRLYDHIGGVNAVTQEDGSPGYGGVFVEGFFGFSKHPNGLAARLPEDNTTFDPIFDPFRVDVGGTETTASELAALQPPTLTDGTSCPAHDRRTQIACAIWVLGSIIGSTMTHEVGHSLGLANPYGAGYHDAGDLPNRLMEVGSARPFDERAELNGEGPSVFCDTAYDYLRVILPSTADKPPVMRPPCD
jgi:hypothetical protein